ncbi:hypothetical protein BSKO_01862 [Bryopsis sp. KO-2023]|nr:hypothetical protein BSKO_01862 [Bryopsis sp. KO-2023]
MVRRAKKEEDSDLGVQDENATPDFLHIEVEEGALAGKLLGRRIRKKWTVLTLGRLSNRNFCLKEPSISDRHAEFHWRQDTKEWWIFDSGSTNGTLVNCIPVGVEGHQVKIDDLVRIGENALRIKIFPYRDETTTVGDFLRAEARILKKRCTGQAEMANGYLLQKYEELEERTRRKHGMIA